MNTIETPPVCFVCNQAAKSNAKIHECHFCHKLYHRFCGKLQTVPQLDPTAIVNQCQSCASALTNATQGNKALTRLASTNSPTVNASAAASNQTTNNDNALQIILGKLNSFGDVGARLAKIEELVAKYDGIETAVAGLQDNFNDWSKKMEVLESLPSLVTRVEETENGLAEVKEEQKALRQLVEQNAATIAPSQALESKILQLEKTNSELVTRLSQLSKVRDNSSSNLVIGGLNVPEGVNLRSLVTSVLATIHPELDTRDIVFARLMIKKAPPQNENGTVSVAAGTKASGKTNPSTSKTSSATSTEPSATVSNAINPPSILVTLSSRPLSLHMMQAKLKFGKLHTSQLKLSADMDSSQLIPSLININEFLPKEIFNLNRVVRQRARQPDSGFTSFVRGGVIYVRRKKGDAATPINTTDDLERFLGSKI